MDRTFAFILLYVLCAAAAPGPATIRLVAPAQGSIAPDTRSTSDPLVAHVADSSFPKPTLFAWSVGEAAPPVAYDLFLSEHEAFDESDLWVRDHPDTVLPVWNLKIGTRYFWKIIARDCLDGAWTSSTGSFETSPQWPRMLFIEGTTNFRDLGGRMTAEGRMIRQGIYYRSAELNTGYVVTEKGMRELNRLGIVCEIDLRNSTENPHPTFPPSVRYVNPKSDSGYGITQYSEGLISVPELYARVFHEIADSRNYPMSCHCRVGADRAGTVAAMVEAIAGCSEEQMGQDYRWTSLSVNDIRDTTMDQWKRTVSYLKSFDAHDANITVGTCNYLLRQGLTIGELSSIRKIFVGDDVLPPTVSVKSPAGSGKLRARRAPTRTERILVNSRAAETSRGKSPGRTAVVDCRGVKVGDYRATGASGGSKTAAPRLSDGVYFIRNGK